MDCRAVEPQLRDKQCGVCLELVEDTADKRYGILGNCDHVFCMPCISKWRQSSAFEARVIRACPVCRVSSEFMVASATWVPNRSQAKARLFIECRANQLQVLQELVARFQHLPARFKTMVLGSQEGGRLLQAAEEASAKPEAFLRDERPEGSDTLKALPNWMNFTTVDFDLILDANREVPPQMSPFFVFTTARILKSLGLILQNEQ